VIVCNIPRVNWELECHIFFQMTKMSHCDQNAKRQRYCRWSSQVNLLTNVQLDLHAGGTKLSGNNLMPVYEPWVQTSVGFPHQQPPQFLGQEIWAQERKGTQAGGLLTCINVLPKKSANSHFRQDSALSKYSVKIFIFFYFKHTLLSLSLSLSLPAFNLL
jgi:hypothetical protein